MIGTFNLPMPPSLWRLYQGAGKTRRKTSRYRRWIEQADRWATTQKPLPKVRGPFSIHIVLDENTPSKKRSDLDNRIKAVLDWMQTRELIVNDRDARVITIGWGFAPSGCQVTLKPEEEVFHVRKKDDKLSASV